MPLPTPQSIAEAIRCDSTIDNQLPAQSIENVTAEVDHSLKNPIDFPDWTSAIVPGDHVVLAVDPSVPQLAQLVSAIAQVVFEADAGQMDVVLWDEATDETVEAIRTELPEKSRVIRHRGESRRDVRYLAADEGADPVYLNRLLVDADLVLPVVVDRWGSKADEEDPLGIFPMLADSSSRIRHQAGKSNIPMTQTHSPSWLLGVQMALAVVPSQSGEIAKMVAGTFVGIRAELGRTNRSIPHADLVIAILSGGQATQTWHNVVRGILSAMEGNEDPTIVLWTALAHPLGHVVRPEFNEEPPEDDQVELGDGIPASTSDEDFPSWSPSDQPITFMKSIESDARVFLRSELEEEIVEATGIAALKNLEELARLSEGFDHARIVPSAQYLASAVLPNPSERSER